MTDIILLDGGMGQELVRRSKDSATPQWSLYVMKHEPHLVQELHEEYLRAGATVLTLNTYATTRGRFKRLGDEAEFIPMQQRGMDLAQAARDAVGVEASLAGCLPPERRTGVRLRVVGRESRRGSFRSCGRGLSKLCP